LQNNILSNSKKNLRNIGKTYLPMLLCSSVDGTQRNRSSSIGLGKETICPRTIVIRPEWDPQRTCRIWFGIYFQIHQKQRYKWTCTIRTFYIVAYM